MIAIPRNIGQGPAVCSMAMDASVAIKDFGAAGIKIYYNL